MNAVGKLIYDYSVKNKAAVNYCCFDNDSLDQLCDNMGFNIIGNLSYCDDNQKIVLDMVMQIDWSAWFDIYTSRIDKRYEYSGVVVVDDENNYYAPIMQRNTTRYAYSPDHTLSIHSHPVEIYDGKPKSYDMPSVNDFKFWDCNYSILVTVFGVIIYCRIPKGSNDYNDKHIIEYVKGQKLQSCLQIIKINWEYLKVNYAKNNHYPARCNDKFVLKLDNFKDEFVDIEECNEDNFNDNEFLAEELYDFYCEEARNNFKIIDDVVFFDFYDDYSYLEFMSYYEYFTDDDRDDDDYAYNFDCDVDYSKYFDDEPDFNDDDNNNDNDDNNDNVDDYEYDNDEDNDEDNDDDDINDDYKYEYEYDEYVEYDDDDDNLSNKINMLT